MIPQFPKSVLGWLDDRRRALGLSISQLAQLSGVSMPTVNRILSDRQAHASWSNVLAIAQALGLNVEFKPVADVEALRAQQAARKAQWLVSMVQSTSALESQAVDEKLLEEMRQQTIHELLAGSRRKLWAK